MKVHALVANRFNAFMDAWIVHRVWGLPLRMVFLCSWHRIHSVVIAIGLALVGLGALLDEPTFRIVGKCVIAPSVLCLILLPILAIVFIGLEHVMADPTGNEPPAEGNGQGETNRPGSARGQTH